MANEPEIDVTEEERKDNVDGWVEVSYDPEGTTANMILHAPHVTGAPISARQAMGELVRRGVTAGIDEEAVHGMVDGKIF